MRTTRSVSCTPTVPRASGPCLERARPAAFLIFLATPTRTGIIPSNFLRWILLPRQHLHDQRRGLLMLEQIGHRLHIWIDMPEEFLVPRAQIIQPRLAIGRRNKPVLRTFSIARKAHLALPTIFGQRLALIQSKRPLLRRVEHLAHAQFH